PGPDILSHGEAGAIGIHDNNRGVFISLPAYLIGHHKVAHPLVGRSCEWAGLIICLGIEMEDLRNHVPILDTFGAEGASIGHAVSGIELLHIVPIALNKAVLLRRL